MKDPQDYCAELQMLGRFRTCPRNVNSRRPTLISTRRCLCWMYDRLGAQRETAFLITFS